jgi:ketosteroid isomerase-like protein
MRHTFPRWPISILTLALIALPCRAAPPREDSETVENLERELVRAIAHTDLQTYDRIVADDYVAFLPSGEVRTKAEIMTSYRTGARGYPGLAIYDVEARVYGDTAVVSARTRGSRRDGARQVANRVRYIRVFARRDGRWRAVAQMSAPLPEQKGNRTP